MNPLIPQLYKTINFNKFQLFYREHKYRETKDTPDLATMHGPVYDSGRSHGYTQAEQVVVDQIPLHGPVKLLRNILIKITQPISIFTDL